MKEPSRAKPLTTACISWFGLRDIEAVEAEVGEADGAVAEREIEIAGVAGGAGEGLEAEAFGDQQRIAGLVEVAHDGAVALGVGDVDVGGEQVDRRGHRLPDGEHVDGGAAGGVVVAGDGGDGEGARALEPVVDVHGQGEFLLAGGGDGVDVAGDGPGGEGLVGVVAEDLRPGAGLFVEGFEQVGGDGRVEDLLRHGREVADQAERAGFVFDLHHEDGVLRVGLLSGGASARRRRCGRPRGWRGRWG